MKPAINPPLTPVKPARHETHQEATRSDAAEHGRYVYVTTPRCPECESKRLRVYGKAEEDDATRRYTRCLECGHKFLVIWE